MGFHVGVPVLDGDDLSRLFIAELVESTLHGLSVATPLAFLVGIGEQQALSFGFLSSKAGQRFPEVFSERGENLRRALHVGALAALELLSDLSMLADGARSHRLFEAQPQWRIGHVPQVAQLIPNPGIGEYQVFLVESLVERTFGAFLGHGAPTVHADAREEDLFVEADPTAPDEHHSSNRCDERLLEVIDNDGRDSPQG